VRKKEEERQEGVVEKPAINSRTILPSRKGGKLRKRKKLTNKSRR